MEQNVLIHVILTVLTRSLPLVLAGEKRELLLVRSYQLLIYYTLKAQMSSSYFFNLISSTICQMNSSRSKVF
ncbi:hypothetical protein [Salinicoccus sesuvii]|uniref:hypothetical protein n=1 Tax=Salinicoccus sesuvii TaxID=868281 RepID=UPI00361B8E1C